MRTRATMASDLVGSVLTIMNSVASLAGGDTDTVRTSEIRRFAGWK